MKNIYYFIITALILISCSKEKKIRRELSGEWSIEKVERKMYNKGIYDTTVVFENAGKLFLYNELGNEYNTCRYETISGQTVYAIRHILYGTIKNQQEDNVHWICDPTSRSRVTLWQTQTDGITHNYSIMTRLKTSNGPGDKETWQYIEIDKDGYYNVNETIYVKLVDSKIK